jgi:hypothetical protein
MAVNSRPYAYPYAGPKASNLQDLKEPWLRRPDESVRAYEAFSIWLKSEHRSLSDVARQLSPACSKANVARWSAKHLWQMRAFEYDAAQEEIQRLQEAKERNEMHRRHLKVSLLMQTVAVHALNEHAAKIEQGRPLNFSPEEAKALLDAGAKLERTTLGPKREHRYSRINVILGNHRWPGERCDCTCVACQSCHGAPEEQMEEEPQVIDAEDGQKKLN